MSDKNNLLKVILLLAVIAVLIFAIIYEGIALTKNIKKGQKAVSIENALEKIDYLSKSLNVNSIPARKAQVNISSSDLKESLPDISKYPLQVINTTDSFIEIFSSPEKAGEGRDGWLVETAQAFNNANVVINGKTVSVKIRGIASGMGMDYIVSKKYIPDAFTPSNELWGEIMKSKGTKITLVDKRLTGNVPGVLISKKKYDELVKKYGAINLKSITEAVAKNEMAMGYTNPFASSTGLNFLVSTLSNYDEKNLLSEKAVQGFEQFQLNIPFVAYITMQMRDAASSGSLDGFIMEYQTYFNLPELKSNYVFTPFGVRHDSPVYEIGELSADKKEILKKFVEFCKTERYQNLASEYGFNYLNEYKPEINNPKGEIIAQAQKLWKEKKNSNSNIAAVFVADISGSMQGTPLNKLKQSLISGSQYIAKDNSIGLVTFSTDVNINLPIAKFDINQKSLFAGAVEDMQAGGSTAMFDGILVATKMLMAEKARNPNAKLMLFVLSDGATNYGYTLNDIEDILRILKIPIYTIGYNANIAALQNISSINEAANINADSDDVVYQLGSLFNAQM